jgi:hypothetical protein
MADPTQGAQATGANVSRVAAEVARCLIGAAQCGSLNAQKWILDRCAPARKGRVVVLYGFPEIRGPEDIAPAWRPPRQSKELENSCASAPRRSEHTAAERL